MEVQRGEVMVCRRSGLHSFNLVPISQVYTNRVLQCILLIVNQLQNYGPLELNHAAHESLITPVVFASKEVIEVFQRGERMTRIEVLKELMISTLSSLCRPEGKKGMYKSFFIQIANLCYDLLRLQIRGSEYLPLSGRDDIISHLFGVLRTQGLVGILPTAAGIPSNSIRLSREIKNVPPRDQTKPAKHSFEDSSLKRKSEEDENSMCPICLNVINDEKDENGTASLPNCSHRFHFQCILKWMQKKQNCPLCRSDIGPKKRQRQ
ncbi:hypothetical protein MKX01_013208 [Papaver californicum]|nr:hypothetical protein MKX01_013208 [Papaver californicum]